MERPFASRITTGMTNEHEINRWISDSRPWVFRLALAIIGQRDAAEDAAQEAVLRASRSWRKIADADDPKAWLRRVLVRCALDELKRNKRAPMVSERSSEIDGDSFAVRQTLNRLDASDRSLLALVHFEQLSYQEIADLLDIPVGTVGSRISKARDSFRKEWER